MRRAAWRTAGRQALSRLDSGCDRGSTRDGDGGTEAARMESRKRAQPYREAALASVPELQLS